MAVRRRSSRFSTTDRDSVSVPPSHLNLVVRLFTSYHPEGVENRSLVVEIKNLVVEIYNQSIIAPKITEVSRWPEISCSSAALAVLQLVLADVSETT